MTAVDSYPSTASQDAPKLDITSTETIEDIEDLDTTPTGDGELTAEELEEEVNDISEEDAEELVETFDQDGDNKLDETEIEIMQEVIDEAVEEGGFDDHRLSIEEIISYLKERVLESRRNQNTVSLSDLINRLDINQILESRIIEIKKTKENQENHQEKIQNEDRYDLKCLMELIPELPKTIIQKLIQLFDKDGDGALNRIEIIQMKNAIEHTMRKDNKTESTEITVEETQPYLSAPTTAKDIKALLDNGGTYHFSYQNKAYTITKNNDTGKYEAFDSKGNKVDSEVQINEENLEVNNLTGMDDGISTLIPIKKEGAVDQTETHNDDLPPETHIMA